MTYNSLYSLKMLNRDILWAQFFLKMSCDGMSRVKQRRPSLSVTVVGMVLKGVCSAAINCYVCEYDNKNPRVGQATCKDPFKGKDNTTTVECGGECQVGLSQVPSHLWTSLLYKFSILQCMFPDSLQAVLQYSSFIVVVCLSFAIVNIVIFYFMPLSYK